MSNLAEIVVITGPTASGKSRLALEIARNRDAEIVNADSVCVYRHFDIGTSKPSAEDLKICPHHLISFLDPSEEYSAGRFMREADRVIREILARGKLPLVVGGTGLYIRALLSGLVAAEMDAEFDEAVFLEREAELKAVAESSEQFVHLMYSWLQAEDPDISKRISANDLGRIRRALRVKLCCDKQLSVLQEEHAGGEARYRALAIALFPGREGLYRAINKRVDDMIAQGLIEEVVYLRKKYSKECKAFGAIGYRHVSSYLDEVFSRDEMVELLKRDTRRYAKRQLTWWRNQAKKLGWDELPCKNVLGDQGVLLKTTLDILRQEFPHGGQKVSFQRMEYNL
ncbi:MAG: tRNA (adenosine(37)-N6)-dimethylallyltransferase MiaA [Deltaproteobacteria bacterium]|nr:tRNA (adenosine(37)-N6)-dimethylallyltransferase MiaA [Deltaproteobacteria bacterium]